VEPEARQALGALARLLDLVAVVTGRDEAVARRMVGADGVTYVGNYGLVPGHAAGMSDEIREAREQARAVLEGIPCVELEDKGTGFSLHYRNCADVAAVRLRLLDAVTPIATMANARLMEGKKVIEVVPGSLPTKREAISHLIERVGARGVVYLGDDLSDVVVFEELAGLRAGGSLDSLTVAVRDSETDASVSGAADGTLDGVASVAAFLAALVSALKAGGGESRA
jgi:trehalose 6-phosphate phosphatase